ncbi:MAG: hypothetical protein Tsb0013_00260 [Phycisphaerales bacterium]
MRRRAARRGFTLPELIVGGVIVALIASSVVLSLSQAIDAERRSRARQQAVQRANALADTIARDVRSVERSAELVDTSLRIGAGDFGSELLVVTEATRSTPPVRAGDARSPTAGTYEVQYRLQRDPRRDGVPGGNDPAHVMWRRVDQLPDRFVDAGGVAYPIATGIRSVRLRAFDGEDWLDDWDTDQLGYPHAIEIRVTAISDNNDYTIEARRIVAVDRVPLPIPQQFNVAGGNR